MTFPERAREIRFYVRQSDIDEGGGTLILLRLIIMEKFEIIFLQWKQIKFERYIPYIYLQQRNAHQSNAFPSSK